MKKIIALLISIVLTDPTGVFLPMVVAVAEAPIKAEELRADRTTLELIEVLPDVVRLRFSDAVRYNSFVTANPPRLVLEILDTELNLTDKTLEGKGKYLKRVRAGQFAGEPNPIARVVMDLNQSVKYETALQGDELLVRLGSGGASAVDEPPKPAPKKVVAPLADPSAAVVLSEPPVKREKAKADIKQGQPQEPGSMSTDTSKELENMAMEETRAAPAAKTKRPSRTMAPALARLRRDILATLPRDPISLDFDNTDIGDILKLMAAKANLNIIYGPDVSGPLTLHLTEVPFYEAFNLILSMKRLIATQAGDNVLRVTTPTLLSKERADAIGITRVFQINYKKASEIKMQIDAVRSAEKRVGSSSADDTNNVLIVTEPPEGLASVERLLAELDIRPRQVLIEAKLVEVSLNKDVHLGIQWDYLGQFPSGSGSQSAVNTIGSVANPLRNTSPSPLQNLNPFDQTVTAGVGAAARGTGVSLAADKVFGAFTLGRITNNYFLTATLTAAASQGKVKVLSDPKIATLNGKTAMINITTQIPYVTSTVSSTGVATQAVSYTTTGIQLSVTPNITADGHINLKVTPTVSKPSAVAAAAGGTGAVAVDTRNADTTVLVRDGETIVIGGLITDSVSNTVAKVPLLGDIPILGWLFKKKSVVRSRVELLIFVTTKIMPD